MTALEQRLTMLGRELDVPNPPDLAPYVLAEIAVREPRPSRRRQLVVVLAVLLVAALVATLAIPDARSSLLRFLSIGGERIELVDRLPAVVPPLTELELMLGREVALEEARRTFDLLELEERPDTVYVGDRGTVWFLYGRAGAVRLLVAQTPGVRVDEPFILKKLVPSGTRVETSTVRGEPAFFLSGEPHAVLLLDDLGRAIEESARLARDVLVWEESGRTVRLEGDFSLEEALALAASLR